MATQTFILAAVFEHESQARRALDALQQAGFGYDQIGIATQAQKGVNLRDELLNLGVAGTSASYYDQEFRAGRTVVSVRPDGRDQEVHAILHRYDGYDYEHQTPETQTAAGYQRDTEATQVQASPANDVQNDFYQPRSLKLREEQLGVTKKPVQTGEVELHKEVVAEQKTINVPVTHEEVVIERHPVTDTTATDATPIEEGETISIPVSEERVNVAKDTVVTGEVVIGKRPVQETQQVADTVKREELSIEQEGDAPLHGTPSDYLHPDQIDPELVKEIKKTSGSRRRKKKEE